MDATAMNDTIPDIDVFARAGCNSVHWEQLDRIKPYPNGNIRIRISAHRGKGPASLAALCFERVGPRDTPGPTPSISASPMDLTPDAVANATASISASPSAPAIDEASIPTPSVSASAMVTVINGAPDETPSVSESPVATLIDGTSDATPSVSASPSTTVLDGTSDETPSVSASPTALAVDGASGATPSVSASPVATVSDVTSEATPSISASPTATAGDGVSDATPSVSVSPMATPLDGASEATPSASVSPMATVMDAASDSTSSVSVSPLAAVKVIESECQQSGCVNLQGPGDYIVIGNSLSLDEGKSDCSLKSSAAAELSLPSGASVVKAVLYWSASGSLPSTVTAQYNKQDVSASKTYSHTQKTSDGDLMFYGAEADVTSMVSAAGTIEVGGISAETDGLECEKSAAYAAWSMVVVYEMSGLPNSQINVCTDNFKYTYPEGSYTSKMQCIENTANTAKGKTTVVAFESDSTAGEYFYINGVSQGEDLFKGTTAPNLDIKSFDIGSLVTSGVKQLLYTVVPHKEGGASDVDGLFFPITVARYDV